METRARSSLAVGLGLVFWMFLLFSPLAWVGQAKADDTDNYGTVIGIVSIFLPQACVAVSDGPVTSMLAPSQTSTANNALFRIWAPPTLVLV